MQNRSHCQTTERFRSRPGTSAVLLNGRSPLADTTIGTVKHVWNVMAHAQKPGLVFQRNGRVHLNWRGGSVQSTTGSRGARISGSNGSNAGYTIFWGRVHEYWLPTPLACFPFTSPTVRHRVPSGFNRSLQLQQQQQQQQAVLFPNHLNPFSRKVRTKLHKNKPAEKVLNNDRARQITSPPLLISFCTNIRNT